MQERHWKRTDLSISSKCIRVKIRFTCKYRNYIVRNVHETISFVTIPFQIPRKIRKFIENPGNISLGPPSTKHPCLSKKNITHLPECYSVPLSIQLFPLPGPGAGPYTSLVLWLWPQIPATKMNVQKCFAHYYYYYY